LKYYAVRADKVLKIMQTSRKGLNIIVLDACRDNPYRSVGKTMNRGLARMELNGSIIAFATAEGETASDVSTNGRNGLSLYRTKVRELISFIYLKPLTDTLI
jgi:uncharacterized caspase-like protein